MTDFLLELLSEEIPARMQAKAKEDLARLFGEALAKAGLAAESVEAFATPRRLALIANGLPLETAAVSEETKGPKVGAPPQAMEGFLRKVGLTQNQLVERDGVYFAVVDKPGRKTADVLAEAIPQIVRSFPWPKSQRWGAASATTESLRWVRPLQGIIALLGDDVVQCEVEGIVSGRETRGHRFHSSGAISIANAAGYVETLRAAHVIVHFSERCQIIREGADAAAKAAGLTLVEDEGLVAENAGLTEWPVPMLGRFDPAFLAVPEEVIQLTARVNQKYFVCKAASGSGAVSGTLSRSIDGAASVVPKSVPETAPLPDTSLANAFLCTANIVAHDGGTAIVAGNEKVLAARLSDAKFFWEQDLKVKLDDQAKKLSQITFHEKLGTVADKVERVAKLAEWLVNEGVVKGCSAADARRAAELCKADLVTGMVGEFPELQGLMGGYYARAQGENDAVADAVRDHYKPVGQGDDVPTAPVTVAVSLADKLDTLCQFFAEDMKPTGSKDPFALRRAALGILELLNLNSIRCRLFGVINQTVFLRKMHDQLIADEVVQFLIDRLKVQRREAGVRHDLIDAVFALGGEDDLVRLLARVKALQSFITTDEGANLLAGYKRAANILKQAEEKSSPSTRDGEGDRSKSGGGAGTVANSPPSVADATATSPSQVDGEELSLLTALNTAEPLAATAIEAERFEDAMAALASLRAPIDAFFDGVMVNDPDPQRRAFRLGLLQRFRDAVHRVADFSKIEG